MLKLAISGSVALLLTGCAAEQRPSQPAQPAPQRLPYRPPPSVAARPAPSNAAYVQTAASIDLFEIRSAELALTRSSSRRVREFAEMMISAHRGTSSQLSFAGRRLDLLPSARLLPRHQAMLDALQVATDFDIAYRQQQLSVHQEGLVLHRTYAARGTSPTLRPVALAAQAVIDRHLRLARYL